ncbi:DUF6179 domain-containing protein [Pelotomaculum terephthalicicum JT]|uniref:DUF6179 domain-containing protein n=1 Tax=Pelotomaculum terephthalicicum TaxID=206393 RepID=UPI001F04897A|nr:DUF6179 domain-containing protein [Pelotomaculum terephthalicicum]MCG9967302.1 DUF6179 domain-containing protein [Pelotomaculum terephthalicicum JT]
MKYTEIEIKTILNKERLDPNQYTLSLLKEGRRAGLIDRRTVDNIQSQIMSLLASLIIRHTKGESTSIKVETAQSIFMSMLYSIDAWISKFNDPEAALACLRTHDIEDTHKKGLALVAACLAETKALYREIKDKKLNVSVKAYHSTIDEALPEFLISYDEVFKAHDTMASVDYPLLLDDMRVKGIFYIKQYLEKLKIENQFCSLFADKDVGKLLVNYGKVYRIDYREALINVFEILITNSIFSVLSESEAKKLSISKYQYALLLDQFKGLDRSQCSSLIKKAFEVLIGELHIEQPQLKDYIRNAASVLMPRYLSALDHDCLDNVVILDDEENRWFDIIFDEGKSMDDHSFRMVVEQIIECVDSAEKTAIITSSIHSLGDFIDVLEANCLFEDEFSALFNALGDMELSILARIVFIEEIRNEPTGFSVRNAAEKPMERQWQTEYARFLLSLSADRIRSIEQYINSSLQETGSPRFLQH